MTGTHDPAEKPESRHPYRVGSPRVLVTLHYPLDMDCVATILKAIARAYPNAVVGENGEVLERPR